MPITTPPSRWKGFLHRLPILGYDKGVYQCSITPMSVGSAEECEPIGQLTPRTCSSRPLPTSAAAAAAAATASDHRMNGKSTTGYADATWAHNGNRNTCTFPGRHVDVAAAAGEWSSSRPAAAYLERGRSRSGSSDFEQQRRSLSYDGDHDASKKCRDNGNGGKKMMNDYQRESMDEIDAVRLFIPKHSYLGVEISGGSDYNCPVRITAIRPDGVAHRCGGLAVGDVILTVNGVSVSSLRHRQVVNLLSSSPSLVVTIQRTFEPPRDVSAETMSARRLEARHIEILLEMRNDSQQPNGDVNVPAHSSSGTPNEQNTGIGFGFVLRGGVHRDPELCRPITVARIIPGSPADREGTLRPGDRILSVDGVDVTRCRLVHAVSLINSRCAAPVAADRNVVLLVEYDVAVVDEVIKATGPVVVDINKSRDATLDDVVLADVYDDSGQPIVYVDDIYEAGTADRSGAVSIGDRILAVDGQRTTGLSAEQVGALIRSNRTQRVTIELLPITVVYKQSIPSNTTHKEAKTCSPTMLNRTTSPNNGSSPRQDITVPKTLPVLNVHKMPVQNAAVPFNSSGSPTVAAGEDLDLSKEVSTSKEQRQLTVSCVSTLSDPNEETLKNGYQSVINKKSLNLQVSNSETDDLTSPCTKAVSFGVELPVTDEPLGVTAAVVAADHQRLFSSKDVRYFISHIVSGGLVDSMSVLKVGDGLLSINGVLLKDKTLDEVARLLSSTSLSTSLNSLVLKVYRRLDTSSNSHGDRIVCETRQSETSVKHLVTDINLQAVDNTQPKQQQWNSQTAQIECVRSSSGCGDVPIVSTPINCCQIELDDKNTSSFIATHRQVRKIEETFAISAGSQPQLQCLEALDSIEAIVESWNQLIPGSEDEIFGDESANQGTSRRPCDYKDSLSLNDESEGVIEEVFVCERVDTLGDRGIPISNENYRPVTGGDRTEDIQSAIAIWDNISSPGEVIEEECTYDVVDKLGDKGVNTSNITPTATQKMSPQMDFERLERHAATLQEVERNNDVTTDVIIPTVRAEAIEIALFPITINGLMIIEEEDESDDNGCRPSSSTAISETNAVDRTPTSAENSMTTTAGCPPSYNSVVVTAGRPTIQLAATTSVAAVTSNNDALLTFDRMQQHKRLSEAVPPGKQRGSFVTAIDHVTSDDQEDDQEDTESCRTVVSAADVEREFVSSSQNRKSKGLHYDRNGAPPPRYSDQSVVNKESAFSEKTVAGNERAREPSKQEALLITDAPTAVNAIGFISRDLIEIKRKCVLPMSMSSSIGDLSSVNSVLSRRNSQLVDWDNSADLVGYGGGAGSRSLDVGLLFDDVSTEPEALADELFDHIFAPSAVEVIRVVLDGSSNSRETDNASMTSSNSSSGLHPALLRSKASDNDSFNPNSSDSTSDSKKDGDRYGFSVSDGLYERGVFVSAVRPGSPAAHKNGLKLFDRILQVGDVITADMDCSQVAPLIARCQGNRVELIVCRRSTRRTRLRNCSTASSPWQRLPRKPALYPGMSSGPLPWKRRGAGGTRVKFYDECLRSTAL